MTNQMDEALAQMDEMLEPEEETPAAAEVEADEVATDQPPAEEEPPKDEPETEPETSPDSAAELLAGKYKTPEELERAYTELQSRLGEQGSELGELRKTIDKLNENLEYEEPARVDQGTVDWLDEQVEQNPAGAAVYALQNAPELYDRVMEAWFEMPGQARQAAEFVTAVAVQRMQNEFDEKLTAQTKPLADRANTAATNDAWAHAAKAIPDLNDNADAMLALLKEDPVLHEFMQQKISTGTVEERSAALRSLYLAAKGQQASTVQDATQRTAAAEAQASKAAKQTGTVASQTSSADAEQVSEGDKWLEEIGFNAVLDRHSPPE